MSQSTQLDLKTKSKLDLAGSIDCPNASALAFEHAIKVYINKPQVVNKWLAGSICLDPITTTTTETRDLAQKTLKTEVREFVPKNNKIFSELKYSVVYCENSVLFNPITKDSDDTKKYPTMSVPHLFEFNPTEQKIHLYIDQNRINSTADETIRDKHLFQAKWLMETLLPKLCKWSMNIKTDAEMSCTKLATLTLYPTMVNDYSRLYQELKQIYWTRFADKWREETNTDPEKFIHEDISIAVYFILVWRYFKLEVRQFVDIGCGNGLLVYILNDQGFKGYGVDMRQRRIWSNTLYEDKQVRLVEQTINPQLDTFEDCDWLIGNHSDELSPWLPVIAAKNKTIRCNFLLIPCCLFDFHSKFEVKKKGESRYDTYLDYLEKIGRLAGFQMHRDKLRIPSTRNVCFIGIPSLTALPLLNELDVKMKEDILNRINGTEVAPVDFKARDLTLEQSKSSRNCTKLDKELKTFIVETVLNSLLQLESETKAADCEFLVRYDGGRWNAGRVMRIGEIAALFDKPTLVQLKQECGGIKTLLKNYHQLFMTFDQDKVKLKAWSSSKSKEIESQDNDGPATKAKRVKLEKKPDSVGSRLKTKQCLFDLMHPDGCLLREEECSFIHS